MNLPVAVARGRARGGGVFDFGLPCEGIVHHGEFDRLQALDLVAQPGGFFEFQVGGGFAHALFHVGQDLLQVVADERGRCRRHPP